ncbi:MAG: hypothetical protein MUE44_04420 [Oscillatoriaceae cyanobacterium Prado104]|jgi:hypothetical protein|nr:hypothetical protein [Oscillatoriaceae cyanobacterium Prado104]
MKLHNFTELLANAKRWIAATLFCLCAIAFVLQGAFLPVAPAIAAPFTNSILATDTGDRVKSKVSEDTANTKDFIRDTADKVERTAKKNAAKVDRATEDGSVAERKAKKDAATIEKRAEEDAARTQKAVDNTKNVVEKAVDSIKNAFD